MNRCHLTLLLVSSVILSACVATSTPTPILEPTHTATSAPTVQLTATSTSRPTATPVTPTATVPVPEGLSLFIQGSKIDYYDPFDQNNGWGIGCSCFVRGGLFTAVGRDWSGASWNERQLNEGQGLLLDFSFTTDAEFEVYINVGDFSTAPYRRFGMYIRNDAPYANLWAGNQPFSGRLLGNLILQPETSYTLAILIGEGGEFSLVVWNPADPSQFVSTHETLGTSWADRVWAFAVGANSGQVEYDNLRFISFDRFGP